MGWQGGRGVRPGEERAVPGEGGVHAPGVGVGALARRQWEEAEEESERWERTAMLAFIKNARGALSGRVKLESKRLGSADFKEQRCVLGFREEKGSSDVQEGLALLSAERLRCAFRDLGVPTHTAGFQPFSACTQSGGRMPDSW